MSQRKLQSMAILNAMSIVSYVTLIFLVCSQETCDPVSRIIDRSKAGFIQYTVAGLSDVQVFFCLPGKIILRYDGREWDQPCAYVHEHYLGCCKSLDIRSGKEFIPGINIPSH